MLTARLRKLEAVRRGRAPPYSERPPRHEYHLTAAGRELHPILLALREWGDRHRNPGWEPWSSAFVAGPSSTR